MDIRHRQWWSYRFWLNIIQLVGWSLINLYLLFLATSIDLYLFRTTWVLWSDRTDSLFIFNKILLYWRNSFVLVIIDYIFLSAVVKMLLQLSDVLIRSQLLTLVYFNSNGYFLLILKLNLMLFFFFFLISTRVLVTFIMIPWPF